MVKAISLGAVVLVALSAPAFAAPFSYICRIDNKGQGEIQPEIIFSYDEGTSSVFVFDALINGMVGKPVAGKVLEDSKKKQVFAWSFPIRNRFGQTAKLAYRASIFQSGLRVNVTATPHGYTNTFTARGRCQRTSELLPGL